MSQQLALTPMPGQLQGRKRNLDSGITFKLDKLTEKPPKISEFPKALNLKPSNVQLHKDLSRISNMANKQEILNDRLTDYKTVSISAVNRKKKSDDANLSNIIKRNQDKYNQIVKNKGAYLKNNGKKYTPDESIYNKVVYHPSNVRNIDVEQVKKDQKLLNEKLSLEVKLREEREKKGDNIELITIEDILKNPLQDGETFEQRRTSIKNERQRRGLLGIAPKSPEEKKIEAIQNILNLSNMSNSELAQHISKLESNIHQTTEEKEDIKKAKSELERRKEKNELISVGQQNILHKLDNLVKFLQIEKAPINRVTYAIDFNDQVDKKLSEEKEIVSRLLQPYLTKEGAKIVAAPINDLNTRDLYKRYKIMFGLFNDYNKDTFNFDDRKDLVAQINKKNPILKPEYVAAMRSNYPYNDKNDKQREETKQTYEKYIEYLDNEYTFIEDYYTKMAEYANLFDELEEITEKLLARDDLSAEKREEIEPTNNYVNHYGVFFDDFFKNVNRDASNDDNAKIIMESIKDNMYDRTRFLYNELFEILQIDIEKGLDTKDDLAKFINHGITKENYQTAIDLFNDTQQKIGDLEIKKEEEKNHKLKRQKSHEIDNLTHKLNKLGKRIDAYEAIEVIEDEDEDDIPNLEEEAAKDLEGAEVAEEAPADKPADQPAPVPADQPEQVPAGPFVAQGYNKFIRRRQR